ncbi:MAG: cytochrome c [Akkermansiaceae bacterium]|jgi:cytochrome c5|nr:cytochrome c [Akkermansiaceae bacterium]MDP4646538.1 cytochrome c [Akkermansiaceae bacterium]MDP4721000.1 cytochrome c [Akkermansiaceae bacterium]MDP4781092.1 cytochrome c [Akkermansiaceae bacterium]MDP4846465.1 cytochrome c [Akkermansiaceae bacterium]
METASRIFGVITAAVLFSGCAAERQAPIPTASMSEKSGEDLAVLKRGYVVYKAQCSRCHEPILPADISSEEWHVVTPGMAWNAGISEADEAAVLKYILAAR